MNVQQRLEVAEKFLLEAVTLMSAAITAGDWVVDGACDPSALMLRVLDTYTQIVTEAHPH